MKSIAAGSMTLAFLLSACVGQQPSPAPPPLKLVADKWQMIHRFDTVTECKENLLWYQKQERRRKLLKRPRVPYVATYGRCIASDDPHLKPKQDTPSSNLGPAPTH